MATRLTINIEESILKKANSYAKQTGRSLSELIENYLETLTDETDINQISSKLKKMAGSIKLPDNFDEKTELRNYLEKKHK